MIKILEKIRELKDWEGSKGRPGYKVRYRQLRQELYDLALPLMENCEHLVVGEYILEKWYDPPSGKTRCMIYTKESFDRKESYQKEKDLSWIR